MTSQAVFCVSHLKRIGHLGNVSSQAIDSIAVVLTARMAVTELVHGMHHKQNQNVPVLGSA